MPSDGRGQPSEREMERGAFVECAFSLVLTRGAAAGRFRCNETDRHVNLRVVEQRHKTKIHVQLLVTVEQGEAGVVGNEIDLDFLIAT